jgi:hypothetical protein
MRHRRSAALTMTLILTAACADTGPTEPAAESDGPALSASGMTVIPLQLRSTGESSLWGELLVQVGVLHPPNPCLVELSDVTVIVCGVIHNPGGEFLKQGTLTLFLSDSRTLQLEFVAPPNPCLTYLVRAAAAPDLGTPGLSLPAVQVEFATERGALVSVRSQAEPPNLIAGLVDGSPAAPPNPCVIQLEADVRAG